MTPGIGRSPTVVIAYLHWVENRDLEQAAGHVQSRRRCSPDLQAIRAAGEGFAG